MSTAPLLNLDALREVIREEVAAVLAAKPAPATVEKALLSLNDVSKMLGLSRKTVARLVREEGLPSTLYGRVHRFERAAVLAWNANRGKR